MATTYKGFENIKAILDDLKKVYYCEDTVDASTDFKNKQFSLQQLPITEDGVTLNFGNANTTFKKLNTGEIWGSKVDRDDPEVSFNVATVSETVNEWFMGKAGVHGEVEINKQGESDGKKENFIVQGYASTLNAKTGSLWFPAENGEGWVVLPNIKMYGGLNGTDDSNTAYYAVTVTPQTNDVDGASIYFLSKNGSGNATNKKLVVGTVSGNVVLQFYASSKDEVDAALDAAGYTTNTNHDTITQGMVLALTAKG